jgi:hypothetical protein
VAAPSKETLSMYATLAMRVALDGLSSVELSHNHDGNWTMIHNFHDRGLKWRISSGYLD